MAGELNAYFAQKDAECSDAQRLAKELVAAGLTREKLIEIVDSYGDPIDWNPEDDITDIIAEVWQSDINSGDEPDNWIINETCRQFNVEEVKE